MLSYSQRQNSMESASSTTSSSESSGRIHAYKKQNDGSVICSWCGVDSALKLPGCHNLGKHSTFSTPITSSNSDMIQQIDEAIQAKFAKHQREFFIKLSMSDESVSVDNNIVAQQSIESLNNTFRWNIEQYYRYDRCFVSDTSYRTSAVYIFPYSQLTWFADCNADNLSSINDPRNGLILHRDISQDFVQHRVAIEVKISDNDQPQFFFRINPYNLFVSSISQRFADKQIEFDHDRVPSIALLQRHYTIFQSKMMRTLSKTLAKAQEYKKNPTIHDQRRDFLLHASDKSLNSEPNLVANWLDAHF